jgi:hypothetical protein
MRTISPGSTSCASSRCAMTRSTAVRLSAHRERERGT